MKDDDGRQIDTVPGTRQGTWYKSIIYGLYAAVSCCTVVQKIRPFIVTSKHRRVYLSDRSKMSIQIELTTLLPDSNLLIQYPDVTLLNAGNFLFLHFAHTEFRIHVLIHDGVH